MGLLVLSWSIFQCHLIKSSFWNEASRPVLTTYVPQVQLHLSQSWSSLNHCSYPGTPIDQITNDGSTLHLAGHREPYKDSRLYICPTNEANWYFHSWSFLEHLILFGKSLGNLSKIFYKATNRSIRLTGRLWLMLSNLIDCSTLHF